jgi:hypothetical protein
LANRTAVKQKRYGLRPRRPDRRLTFHFYQQRELAELKQRLEKLQQTLREHGYLNDGGASMESARAKAQVQRIHTIDDFRKMEQSLEERVKALTSRPNGPAEKARSTKMMEELGRRFLYE